MADLTRLRRTVRVLQLLQESFLAHQRGDRAEFERATSEALAVDADAVQIIRGGMMIGEIPNPQQDEDGWVDYVTVVEQTLAAAMYAERQEATDAV